MTGPEPAPYGGEGYNPPPQPQFGAPQPAQYPPAPQPPQYPPAPQPPQYGQPPAGAPYGQPPAGAPYGQPPAGAPYGQPPAGAPYGQVPPVPPYGQPPAPPFGQPPTVRNRKPLIYGGIAAAVLIIAIIVTVGLVSGGSGTPKGVLQDYLTAAKNGDVNKAKSLTCDKYKDDITASGSDSGLGDLASIDFAVQDSHENGDTATVNLKITYKANVNLPNAPSDLSGSIVIPVSMVKEHGAWKVCMK